METTFQAKTILLDLFRAQDFEEIAWKYLGVNPLAIIMICSCHLNSSKKHHNHCFHQYPQMLFKMSYHLEKNPQQG
jgi:hypothetical protein